MALTPKQKRFIEEHLIDLNATKAALRAGYSEKTATEIGYENLTKPHIYTAIEAAKKARSERLQVDSDYVLKRLVEIDKMSIDQIFRDDFSVRPLSEWPPIWRQMLSVLDVKEVIEEHDGVPQMVHIKRLRWPDKLKNLELLGRHVDVRAFQETYRHKHDLDDRTVKTLRDVLAGARRKGVRH